jgi:hypothetical protein
MRDIALAQGFVEGVDFQYLEAAWHTHSEFYWAARFPVVLRFLIDPPGTTLGVPGDDARVGSGIRRVSPNPFRSSTRIELALDSPGPVRAEVYDVAGRLVRRLLDETVPAGTRYLSWDGRDGGGRTVAPGVYWLRLRSGFRNLDSTRLVRLP